MNKNLLYSALGFMVILGALSIGVVKAETIVTYHDDSNISYTLNSGIETQETFEGVGTITISNGETTITMLDRNLGAIEVAVAGYYNSSNSYGRFFQRQNNYGFSPTGSLPTLYEGLENTQISSSSVNNGYINRTLHYGYDNWIDDNSINNLWGGRTSDFIVTLDGDNWKADYQTITQRQGPCPEGFHIPSYGERLKVINMMGNDVSQIRNELKIPLAGGRARYDGKVYYQTPRDVDPLGQQLQYGFLWASSPYPTDGPFSRVFRVGGSALNINNDHTINIVGNYRADAYPIRCFYNEYEEYCHMEGDKCVNNTKEVPCNTTSLPSNANPIIENVKITWDKTNGRSQPQACQFTCNNGHFGNNCEISISHHNDSNISYTLNSGIETQETFEGVGTITISNGETTITMLDRNLGATSINIGEPISYGYFFQRQNNYGFPNTYSNLLYGQVSADTVHTGYNNPTLHYGHDNWIDDNSINNLWGGSASDFIVTLNGDNWKADYQTITQRQGPCPEGFHIPNYGERLKVINMMGNDVSQIRNELKIPLAGGRARYYGQTQYIGQYGFLWTSSPYPTDGPFSRVLRIIMNGSIDQVNIAGHYRADAYPIRCFYNFYGSYSQYLPVIFISEGEEAGRGNVMKNSVYTETIPSISKEGYELEYRYLSGTNEISEFDIENNNITPTMADEYGIVYFIAQWSPKEYAITFIDGSGENENVIYSGTYESTITANYPSRTRNGYTISRDKEIPSTMPLNGDTITASWTPNKSSGGNSGGGGKSNKTSDTQTSPNPSLSRGEEDSSLTKEGDREAVEDLSNNTQDSSAKASKGHTYTQEFQQAYDFAYKNGITTMNTIDKANIDGKLTRIAMAKMLSQYAINVLGKEPDTSKGVIKFRDVTNKMNLDYNDGVTLAYQLGIMGINMPNNEFRPNDYVTRAEFSTALSRMLYSTPDGKPYYTTHLEKLKKEGIITNDDYKMKELRGYIMIMLMRAAK